MPSRRKPQGFTPIQSAGRALSAANAGAIKDGLLSISKGAQSISQVLKNAGVVDTDYLEEEDAEEDAEEKVAAAAQPISASSFTEAFARRSWMQELSLLLRAFKPNYCNLHCLLLDAEAMPADVKTEDDRATAITDLLDEFQEFLIDHATEATPAVDSSSRISYYPMEMGAEAATVEAGRLGDAVERQAWFGDLNIILDEFQYRYCNLCWQSLSYIKEVNSEETRQTAIAALITDLRELLDSHSEASPEPFDRYSYYGNYGYYDSDGLYASAKRNNGIVARSGQPGTGTFEDGELIEARIALEGEVALGDRVLESADVPESIELQARSNLHPVEGVLFRVDEPSESPPSVGPGLPLYIPRSVAESVLDVANKPLEASDTLTKHAKEGTIGVMTEAEIQGNDFIYRGFVWPYNHEQKVEAISAAKEILGASMNARAKGHVATVGDTQVYWIDQLELLGGCLLFSELATYRKTRTLNADAQRLPVQRKNLQPIAASATQTTSQPPGASEIMDPVLQRTLDNLSAQIAEGQKASAQQYQQLEARVGTVAQQVGVLEQERQMQIQASQQQQQLQASQQQQQQLVEAIGKAVATEINAMKTDLPELVKQQVSLAVNPRQVPIRPGQTVPLLAQAANASNDTKAVEYRIELARVGGQLEVLAASQNPDGVQQMQLLDRKRDLEALIQATAN